MPASFDLIDQPWIPCTQRYGIAIEHGLRDVLVRAHELRGMQGETPLETAALHRLLLAVLHRVFGPAGYAEWDTLWQAGRWNAVQLDGYFERWHNRFDLFDPERPFYQAADERVKPKSVISLIHHLASGNNATLFDHHTETTGAELTPAQAARALLVAQSFGIGGLSGLPEKFTDAPCARGVIFLVAGDTLFETLALNLMRYATDRDGPLDIKNRMDDLPAWEMDDPFQPDRDYPLGYLDYLTWQNRRIMLFPEQTARGVVVRKMTWAPGLRMTGNILEPAHHFRKDSKAGYRVLRFNTARALWRDSAALFQLQRFGAESSARPPQVFAWLSELIGEGYVDAAQTYHCRALGMAKDRARIDFYRQEHFSVPLVYLEKIELVGDLAAALDSAEKTSNQLWGAVNMTARLMLSQNADQQEGRQPDKNDVQNLIAHWGAKRHYWSRLEAPFWTLLHNLPQDADTALQTWRQTLERTAWLAFTQVETYAGGSARALKAAARGRRQLAGGLAKTLHPQT